MLTGRVVACAILLVGATALPAAAEDPPGTSFNLPGQSESAGASASGGSVSVVVSASGQRSDGGSFSTAVHTSAPVTCWYGRGMSGQEYYEYWKPGGQARQADTLDDYAAQGLLHADYEAHADDATGYWYEAACDFDAPSAVIAAFYDSHPAVFVPAGDAAPAAVQDVDPAVLAQLAAEQMDLPTGQVRWNPAVAGSGAGVVGMDTWVWVEGAPTSVQVRAQVEQTGTWAQVVAVLDRVRVASPVSAPVVCDGAGVAWSPGARSSDCVVVFDRSTAGRPVKAGQSLPTVTVTARATWTATWTSSLDANPRPLDVQTVDTTAEVPVAEIQTLVTDG